MIAIQAALAGLFFLVELAALAAFGYWGFRVSAGAFVRTLLGIGAPVLVATFWGMFVAPKATFPVSGNVQALLQFIVFTLAAIALYGSGKTGWAILSWSYLGR